MVFNVSSVESTGSPPASEKDEVVVAGLSLRVVGLRSRMLGFRV